MSESMQHRVGRGARWALIVAVAATGGCARAPEPEVAAAPLPGPVAAAPIPEPTVPATRFSWTARSTSYDLATQTVVQVVGDSVPAGSDTVTVRAVVTLAFAGRGDYRSIAGTVSDASVAAGDRLTPPGPVARGAPSTVQFSGEVGPGTASVPLSREVAEDCVGPAASLVAAARELVPPIPAELRVGDRWSDSVTTTGCRAGVRITTIARHEYEVEAMEMRGERPTVRIQRSTALQISGGGEQSRRTVVVDGTGRGMARLWADPAAGHLVELDASTTVMLRHQAGDRVATVEQVGNVRAQLRP